MLWEIRYLPYLPAPGWRHSVLVFIETAVINNHLHKTIVNGSSFHINYRFLGYRYCVQSSDKLTPIELLIII